MPQKIQLNIIISPIINKVNCVQAFNKKINKNMNCHLATACEPLASNNGILNNPLFNNFRELIQK